MSQGATNPPLIPLGYTAPEPPGRHKRRWLLWTAIGAVLFILLLAVAGSATSKSYRLIPLSEFYANLRSNNVTELTIGGDEIRGTICVQTAGAAGSGTSYAFSTMIPPGASSTWAFTQWLLDHAGNATINVDNASNLVANILLPVIPWLLIFFFIWFFIFKNLRKTRGRPTAVYLVAPPDGSNHAAPPEAQP